MFFLLRIRTNLVKLIYIFCGEYRIEIDKLHIVGNTVIDYYILFNLRLEIALRK